MQTHYLHKTKGYNTNTENLLHLLSHELRAPIANILGLAKLLNNKAVDSSIKERMLEKLITETETLDSMVNKINQKMETTNMKENAA